MEGTSTNGSAGTPRPTGSFPCQRSDFHGLPCRNDEVKTLKTIENSLRETLKRGNAFFFNAGVAVFNGIPCLKRSVAFQWLFPPTSKFLNPREIEP